MTESLFRINQQELLFSQELGHKLHELAHSFMESFQLSHVFFGKDYFDGRFFNISTDVSWKKITVEQEYHKDFTKKYMNNIKLTSIKPLFFLWERDSAQTIPVLDHIHAHSGATSGFNLLIPHNDHFENFGFASTKPLADTYNALPDQNVLELFCLYLQQELMKLPEFQRPVYGVTGQNITPIHKESDHTSIPLPTSFPFACNRIEGSLTRQEFLCLGLLSKGYGQKEIAHFLDISPRTVESYLTQIKIKFDTTSKSKLVTSFNGAVFGSIDLFKLIQK